MKSYLIPLIFLIICTWTLADEPDKFDKADAALSRDKTNCTVITSTRLSYDRKKCIAVFEENVVVTDDELNIQADKMNVLFTKDNKVLSIEAEGNVIIANNDRKGFANKAVYYVEEGKVVLSDGPKIIRGSDEMSGETITFWRFEGRILCEPNAVLKIYSAEEMRL